LYLDHAPSSPGSEDIHSGGSDKLDSESESSKPEITGGKPFGFVFPSKFGRMLRDERGGGGMGDECDGDDREAWICGFESFGESLIDTGASLTAAFSADKLVSSAIGPNSELGGL